MSAGITARALTLVVLATLLSGCPKPTRPTEPAAPAPAPPTPAPTQPVSGATYYEVSPGESTLDILVYRAGALARLGHNHVMSARNLQGRIWTHTAPAQSGFDVSFPVAQIVVDDPEARRAAGSEFPPDISQSDRDGTRKNMLREEVLDAGNFPRITLKSLRFTGPVQKPQITARVTIRDVSREVPLAPTVKIEGSRLTVAGELDLLQSDFGIEPFTAALGALTVQDRLRVRFRVVADRK